MKKRFLGIICLLYAGIIIYELTTNNIKNFLAPNMQVYLKIVVIPLALIGLVLLFNNHVDYKFKISDLVLLLPLIMLIFASDARLTENLARNRNTGFNRNTSTKSNKDSDIKEDRQEIETKTEVEKEEVEEQEEIKYDFSNPDFYVIDENYDEFANYLSYAIDGSKYVGKTIMVRGFSQKYANYLPDEYFVVGKYLITCCTADAGYVGFFVKYDMSKIKNNTWYEIEGILEQSKDKDGYNIMVINAINVKEIKSNEEEQYVYPCYAYGDGSCSEALKYNLEH